MPSQKQTEKQISEVSRLLVRWDSDWDHARPYFDEFKEDYLAYKFYRDPNSHPYKYNPVVPLVWTISENMVSSVFNTFFTKSNTVTIQPVERTHSFLPGIPDEKIARQLEKVINLQRNHPDIEFMDDMYDLNMETVVFGNGGTCTIPVFDNDQPSELGGGTYIGCKTMPKTIWQTVPDKEGYRYSNCRWIWEFEWIGKDELKERIENPDLGYEKLDKETINKLTGDDDWIPEDYHQDVLSNLGKGARREDGIRSDGMILLLHFYDKKTGHYKTIAGNRMLVRDTSKEKTFETPFGPFKMTITPYPYNPYDDIKLWPFPREFYAMGTGKVARGFQDDINLLKSMRLENIELGIHKVFLYNDIYGVDVDDLFMIPGGAIATRDVNQSVKVLDVGDITQNAYVEQAMWEKEAQDSTSSHEITRGSEPHRRETATTAIRLERNSFKRTETFIKRSSRWHKSVTLKHIIQIRTYMSQAEYERILGEPDAGFFRMDLNDIKRMFDILPSGSSIDQIRDIEQQNFVNALQLIKGFEGMFNANELAKLFFELFFPDKNPDKYVVQGQPLQPAQGQVPPSEAPSGATGTGQPTISPEQLIQGALQGNIGG